MSGGISLCKNVKDLHASPRLARSTALEGAIFDAQVIGPRACSPPSPHVQCVGNPRGRNRIASSNPAKLVVFLLERRLLHPFTYLGVLIRLHNPETSASFQAHCQRSSSKICGDRSHVAIRSRPDHTPICKMDLGLCP